jgi:hypothetical protein
MKNVLHLIAEDLTPIIPSWITADTRWELHAHSNMRVGFRALLERHAEADRIYRTLYEET